MKIKINKNSWTVTRQKIDPKAKNESHFWYLLKMEAIKRGHDVVKRLMDSDGHMVSSGVASARLGVKVTKPLRRHCCEFGAAILTC